MTIPIAKANKAIQLAIEKLAQQNEVHVHFSPKDQQLIINPNDITKRLIYKPSKTCLEFHNNSSKWRLIMGPYGSGKSTTCCVEIVTKAILMPPCNDGIRRSRWIVIRNTTGELETTTIKTWNFWFFNLAIPRTRKKPIYTYEYKFNDSKGEIHLELLFMALDNDDDIRKLASLEATGFYFNECRDISKVVFDHASTRLGRYPPKNMCSPYWTGIICDTNPPDIEHWIYKLFEIDKPDKHTIFHQPAALIRNKNGTYSDNPDAENTEHLSEGYDYYHNMIIGKSKEFIDVYALGKYGLVKRGMIVYTSYNDNLHSVESIEIDKNESILLLIDYGSVCPAFLLAQYVNGQFRAIKEFIGQFTSIDQLYKVSVLPYLEQYCLGLSVEAWGDPAKTDRGQSKLEDVGLFVQDAPTNNIDSRISAVTELLTTLVDGYPRYILSRKGCPNLRLGFMQKYYYKRLRVIGEDRYQDVPDKNHPFSDIHDCNQYGALICTGNLVWKESEYDKGRSELNWQRKMEGQNRVTGY